MIGKENTPPWFLKKITDNIDIMCNTIKEYSLPSLRDNEGDPFKV